jgi:hypothetical protein
MSMITELEARLRPGAWSKGGFLGPGESLQAVIERDDELVTSLGLTHAQVAGALEEVLLRALSVIERQQQEVRAKWLEPRASGPRAARKRLQERAAAGEAALRARVGALEVEIRRFLGSQHCPWSECFTPIPEMWGSNLDWVMRRLDAGGEVAGPGLIVHLIREHRFFEGRLSPYRVDPEALAVTLGLVR